MSSLPTGTITFLFTDIEGSTRLWEEHPEAMRTALERRAGYELGRGGGVCTGGGDGGVMIAALAEGPNIIQCDLFQQGIRSSFQEESRP